MSRTNLLFPSSPRRQRMLGGTTGPEGPNWALVGMVREPVSRYLSWFFYYSEPDSRISVADYARRGLGANGAIVL